MCWRGDRSRGFRRQFVLTFCQYEWTVRKSYTCVISAGLLNLLLLNYGWKIIKKRIYFKNNDIALLKSELYICDGDEIIFLIDQKTRDGEKHEKKLTGANFHVPIKSNGARWKVRGARKLIISKKKYESLPRIEEAITFYTNLFFFFVGNNGFTMTLSKIDRKIIHLRGDESDKKIFLVAILASVIWTKLSSNLNFRQKDIFSWEKKNM